MIRATRIRTQAFFEKGSEGFLKIILMFSKKNYEISWWTLRNPLESLWINPYFGSPESQYLKTLNKACALKV